jgi:hypothetical protein
MESSRDSSVWRNLAVTFGGGLALGAVGMKLTQTALRPADVTPRPDASYNPLTDRLSSVERRLERVEQAPASPRPAPAAAAAGQTMAAPMDQKVLEAVIGAVDARLHEHSGQVERRLADLEARLAVSHQQDRQATEQLRQEAAALRSGLEQETRQVRESVARTLTAQSSEMQALRQQNERIVDAAEQRFADMRYEYTQGMTDLRESVFRAIEGQAAAQEQKLSELRSEMEQSVETRIVTAAAAAVAARMEEQLAPMRAEVQQKEQELTELRQRLADSEKSVLDVVLAIGEVCRQAAERIGGPRESLPAAPPAAPALAPVVPIAELRPKEEAAPAVPVPAPPLVEETPPVVQALAEPALAPAIPDFLRDNVRRADWRIPLVSSFLVSTGYLVLMHYLSAPLQ